jgi:indolepyruvate ferredoxin oxidoreductase, alpha subunit
VRAAEETAATALADALAASWMDSVLAVPGRPLTAVAEALVAAGRARWVNHEAVALQQALGMAGSGRRTAVLLKQVGLNASLDVLACAAPLRIGGALVIVVGDDPGAAHSQVEGDSRMLALAAEVPCLEPAGPDDVAGCVADATALSQRVRVPVVLRVTTQLANASSRRTSTPVVPPPAARYDASAVWFTDPVGHRRMLLRDLRDLPDDTATHASPHSHAPLRVVASGMAAGDMEGTERMAQLHVRRVVPIPEGAIEQFLLGDTRDVLVVEDGRPLLEDAVRALRPQGRVLGRRTGHVPWAGPVRAPDAIQAVLQDGCAEEPGPAPVSTDEAADLAGYGTLFDDAAALGLGPIAVDAGNSWAAGYLPGSPAPYSYGLGSAIGVAAGVAAAEGHATVAAIGDFGMYHAGILGLLQVACDQTPVITVVLEDGVASYTGGQPTLGAPGRADQHPVSLEQLCRGAGIDQIEQVTADQASSGALRPLLAGLAQTTKPSVVIIRAAGKGAG